MAIVNLSYCYNGNTYPVVYNDSTHSIQSAGTMLITGCSTSPVAEGAEIYIQNVSGGYYKVSAQPLLSGYHASVEYVSTQTLKKIVVHVDGTTDVSSPGATDGTITLSATPAFSGPFEYSINDGATWQSSNVFSSLPPTTYKVRARILAEPDVISPSKNAVIGTASLLSAYFTKSNVTTAGGSDGFISVMATGGSGSYLFEWTDTETGAVRDNLTAGVYEVGVTDTVTLDFVTLIIVITEPSLSAEDDPYFDIPVMQSIHFTPNLETNERTVFETPDNKLLNEQKHPNFRGLCYFQKVMKGFSIAVQIHSNRENNTIEIYDEDNELIETINLVRVAQYTGNIEQYSVELSNHGDGKTKVYFYGGTYFLEQIPVNVSAGDVLEITNNGFGYNGLYEIIDIGIDLVNGSQYLIINLTSGIPTTADALFSTSVIDYDIYEGTIETENLPTGYYYLKAFNDDSDPWYSELIKVVNKTNKLNLIEFTNADNAFGIDYSNNITHRLWVESLLFKRVPTVDKETLRNTDGKLNMLAAKPQRRFVFELFSLPPYLLEKIAIAFSHDVVTINGIEYISSEGLEEPEYIDKFGLASTRITVEQRNWLNDYNGNDIGGVNIEQGYLVVNKGFLKL